MVRTCTQAITEQKTQSTSRLRFRAVGFRGLGFWVWGLGGLGAWGLRVQGFIRAQGQGLGLGFRA